jgi:hypothetical protein
MKRLKKLISFILVFGLMLGILVIPSVDVQAASTPSAPKAIRIRTDMCYRNDAITVTLANGGDYIGDLKTSSKDLIAKVTWINTSTDNAGESYISVYSAKEGKYKVTFNVYNKKGKKLKAFSVKVYVSNTDAIKSMTYGGKKVECSEFSNLMTKKSGKFSVKLNKGYKLKKIQVTTYNKKGKAIKKTIKNNSTLTLGKYRGYDDSENTSDDGSYYSHFYYSDMFATTDIILTITDTYTQKDTESYITLFREEGN